jgi:hypothetical protein
MSCSKCVSTNFNTVADNYSGSGTHAAAGYSTLGKYYKNFNGVVAAGPLPASTVVIPSFGGSGYNALQHGQCNNSAGPGYFSLCSAYPNTGGTCPGNCQVFTSRSCGM